MTLTLFTIQNPVRVHLHIANNGFIKMRIAPEGERREIRYPDAAKNERFFLTNSAVIALFGTLRNGTDLATKAFSAR